MISIDREVPLSERLVSSKLLRAYNSINQISLVKEAQKQRNCMSTHT